MTDIGHSSKFEIETGSPATWTAVAEVTSITPPGLSRDSVDVTHMQSTEKWREFIAGLKDGGEVTLEINFNPADDTSDTLMTQFDTDTLESYRITFPNGAVWTFDGFVTGFEPEAPLDDKIMATVTIKVSGKPTLAES